MKNTKTNWLFLFALSLFSISVAISAQAEDKKDDEYSARFINTTLRREYNEGDDYIRSILQQHEEAFPHALRYRELFYYTDLRRVSQIQRAVLSEFLALPDNEYLKDWSEREPMTQLEVTVAHDSFAPAVALLRPSAWKYFKEDIVKEINKSLEAYKGEKNKPVGQGFVVFMRILLENFEPSSKWDTRIEDKLVAYLYTYALLKQNPEMTFDQLISKVENIGIGSLDYLSDAHFYEEEALAHYTPNLDSYNKATEKKEKASPVAKAVSGLFGFISGLNSDPIPPYSKTELVTKVKSIYDKLDSRLFDRTRPLKFTTGDKIHIHEVHPNMAIFRGYVGNDCSTSFSPGFVLTPFDRYYYVFDHTGMSLGYVGLSIVTYKGQKALYMHTIQGPDLSAEVTYMVMRAFAKTAKKFGAKNVLLSKDGNIDSNVNFAPIRDAMTEAVAAQPLVPVEWHDVHYRNIISKWDSTMTYDNPSNNLVGRVLRFDDPGLVSVQVKQTPFVPEFTDTGAVDYQPKDITGRKYGPPSLSKSSGTSACGSALTDDDDDDLENYRFD